MPRRSQGARLWLRPARKRSGRGDELAVWLIRDGGHVESTGCGARDRAAAERRLAAYIAAKYAPQRRERDLAAVPVADVINIYLTDVAPGQARPEKAAERGERLIGWWGDKALTDVSGATCRAYAASRGNSGGARRDLQDLAAAINHHAREGLHRGSIRVALPPRGQARQRWLTRDEAARLLWVCWRTREVQNGHPTGKRPLRHLARFLLLGLYTGSRPGAILNASWLRGPRRSFVDLESGVFHRRADGAVETANRQPTVKLAPRLLTHLRRWRRLDAAAGRAHVVTFDGLPIASVKTALGRACDLAGLDAGVTAYTLRHTCASWLVAKGLPTRLIADFLGTSEAMIVKHYGHLAPDYQDAAAAAIGQRGGFSGGSSGAKIAGASKRPRSV